MENRFIGIVFFVFFLVWGCCVKARDVSGRTFFMPRAIGSDAVLLNAGWHDFIEKSKHSCRFFLSASGFYQESTNGNDIAQYFFPCGKRCLQIKGALAEGDRDVSATWLQIAGKNTSPDGSTFPDGTLFGGQITRKEVELYLNEFQSKVSIDPHLKRFGTILQLHTSLDFISPRLWLSLDLPCVYVETNTRLNEQGLKNAVMKRNDLNSLTFQVAESDRGVVQRSEHPLLGQLLNARQALNNPLWKYGKIKCGTQKLAGLADIHGKIGFKFLQKKSVNVSAYGNIIVPTGYEPTGAYMFEPIVGNGQHLGLGLGVNFDAKFIDDKRKRLIFASQIDYVYLLENTQKRSFDLKENGQWSRYLLVVDRERANKTLQPGINFFTRKVKVTPQSEINWTNSFNFSYKRFVIEAGYNLWFKDKEKITFNDCFPTQLFIANHSYGARDATQAFSITSFSQATIKKHMSDDEADTDFSKNIKACDLDLCSGRHPSRLTHKIYLSVGANTHWCKEPVQLIGGGSYEFADDNRGLDMWSVWVKFSIDV